MREEKVRRLQTVAERVERVYKIFGTTSPTALGHLYTRELVRMAGVTTAPSSQAAFLVTMLRQASRPRGGAI